MRELRLSQSVFDQALHRIQKDGGNRVALLHIALGELFELAPASFQTQWSTLSKGALAEHAQLCIRLIPAEVQCMVCFQKYHPADKKILCPYCGSFGAKILTREECYLESNETEHE